MSVSKIKNLILLILLLAVACLLPAVVPTQAARTNSEKAMQEKLAELYASYGLDVDADSLPASATLYTIELSEPDGAAAAQALLGSGAALQQDASTSFVSIYAAGGSQLSLSRSGSLSARLEGQGESRDLLRTTKRLLRAMDFEVAEISDPTREAAGVYCVSAVQGLLGVPVFESVLVFTYRNDELYSVDGTYYPAADVVRTSQEPCISCADALVALLASRDQLGWVGGQITAVTQGYIHSETASSAMRFVPVWRIDTDAGSFYVNGMTREVRQIAA